MSFFARLLRIAPAGRESELERGARALRAGRLDEAERALDAALASAPDARLRALVHNKRAVLALARGDREGGRARLAAALAADPTCVPALINVANLRLEEGDLAGAIAGYDAALRLDPDSADAHHNLGVAYRRAGRRGDSVRELRKATGLERRRKNLRL